MRVIGRKLGAGRQAERDDTMHALAYATADRPQLRRYDDTKVMAVGDVGAMPRVREEHVQYRLVDGQLVGELERHRAHEQEALEVGLAHRHAERRLVRLDKVQVLAIGGERRIRMSACVRDDRRGWLLWMVQTRSK